MEPANPTNPAPSRRVERQSAQIGQMLIDRGVITPQQLDSALAARAAHAGKPLGDILVEMKFASRRDVLSALAAAVGIPFSVITSRMVNPQAVVALPREFLTANNLLPLSSVDGWITVAAEDFTNVFLTEEIKRLSGQKVQVIAAEPQNIREVREQLIQDAPAPAVTAGGDLSGLEQANLDELTVVTTETKRIEEDSRDLEAAAAGSPIIRLVNHMIKTAVEVKASDIHIEPDEHDFRIRYRIDGELSCEVLRPPARLLPAVVSRIKIMGGMDISERRLPQDGGITVALGGRPIELRVSTMATTFGEKVVIRVVDNSAGVRKLEDLGFSPRLLKDFRRAFRSPNGIVLVTGPTGSGKSTTLYSALSEITSPTVNISSIEDPVEFHLKGINQFQVNAKTGFTFARAMRAMLRQDPDVMMVGEIRDTETAHLATEAALTGHLVLSTLHTNDAPAAVPRIVNMGVEPYLVAASLRAVLAQRLVRRLCPHCRRRAPVRPALKKLLAGQPGIPPIDAIHEGAGCDRCRKTGFSGRTGIHELLVCDEEMLEDLGRDMSLQTIRNKARERGFISLLDDCMEKVRAGIVGIEAINEVLGHYEPEEESQNAAAPAAA